MHQDNLSPAERVENLVNGGGPTPPRGLDLISCATTGEGEDFRLILLPEEVGGLALWLAHGGKGRFPLQDERVKGCWLEKLPGGQIGCYAEGATVAAAAMGEDVLCRVLLMQRMGQQDMM